MSRNTEAKKKSDVYVGSIASEGFNKFVNFSFFFSLSESLIARHRCCTDLKLDCIFGVCCM